jgi:hypothetical protein
MPKQLYSSCLDRAPSTDSDQIKRKQKCEGEKQHRTWARVEERRAKILIEFRVRVGEKQQEDGFGWREEEKSAPSGGRKDQTELSKVDP